MTARVRPAPGGGRVVEVAADRLVGWVNRFAARNGGLASVTAEPHGALLRAGAGGTARLHVPFGPLAGGGEPVEAVLAHLARLGDVALLLARGADHSVGVGRAGSVLVSSTDARYLQGRTAAGGWSQQRFARRRDNQRRHAERAAVETALRVWSEHAAPVCGVVVGGQRHTYDAILADPRLARWAGLPRRVVPDMGQARRAELDRLAARGMTVEVTVTDPPPGR